MVYGQGGHGSLQKCEWGPVGRGRNFNTSNLFGCHVAYSLSPAAFPHLFHFLLTLRPRSPLSWNGRHTVLICHAIRLFEPRPSSDKYETATHLHIALPHPTASNNNNTLPSFPTMYPYLLNLESFVKHINLTNDQRVKISRQTNARTGAYTECTRHYR